MAKFVKKVKEEDSIAPDVKAFIKEMRAKNIKEGTIRQMADRKFTITLPNKF